MSSEATERQGADDNALEDDARPDETGSEAPSEDDDRLEARAQPPTRIDEEEIDEDEGTEEASSESLVPAPSEATSTETGEPDRPGDEQAPAPDAGPPPTEPEDTEAGGEEPSTQEEEPDDEAADDLETAAETAPEEEEASDESEHKLDLPEFSDLEGQATKWLAGLFERMNLDASAEFFREKGEPRVDVTGADADRLLGLGKLGPKAIEGVETLLQSVFSEDDEANDVYVDVEGKRADRKEMLQDVADRLADRAVDFEKTVTISGLNSTERRIIHRQLRDYDGVDTESVGDGIFRRLTIEPTR